MLEGPYAGFPVVDVRVVVYDGSMHEVDSSDKAFHTCGQTGFRNACRKAGMELLEPVMSVEVTAPEDCTGAITANLCGKRGKILEMDTKNDTVILRGRAPLAEMFGYASELRNMTSGRGTFSMHFEHYESVPHAIAEEIVKTRKELRGHNT